MPTKPKAASKSTKQAASPAKKPKAAPRKATAPGEQTDPGVIALLASLDHPLRNEIEAVRQMILEVAPEIGEAIKWNAPSFRTTEFFATFNLRSKDAVQLVFHLGAKARNTPEQLPIADPAGLMKWLAKDRCLVTLGAGNEVAARQTAFQSIVREWIRHV